MRKNVINLRYRVATLGGNWGIFSILSSLIIHDLSNLAKNFTKTFSSSQFMSSVIEITQLDKNLGEIVR